MAKYVAENTIKSLIKAEKQIKGAKVALMGLTFKENCPDTRNTKVIDIIEELKEYGIEVLIYDPVADEKEAFEHYGIKLNSKEDLKDVDAVVTAVAHNELKNITLDDIESMFTEGSKVLIDIKGMYDKKEAQNRGLIYWRL
ncbi:UDP binding domain-containing protein [[Clostridium] dakarense]|uniref:UDP binding domain-containing protein n=1 Tax=Faecalimicrobium dakarense TaxID=1301100 RepID=UPI0004BA5888|nr:UDP binding domain-containing protein [[Clostridium] dakarense]